MHPSVRIPPGASGWHVVVHLESKVQFADGRDVRSIHGLRGATPLGIEIGGGCSLENIGTGTTRVVSGRIVREGAF